MDMTQAAQASAEQELPALAWRAAVCTAVRFVRSSGTSSCSPLPTSLAFYAIFWCTFRFDIMLSENPIETERRKNRI